VVYNEKNNTIIIQNFFFMELNPAFRYIFFAFAFFNPNKKKDAAAIRAKRLSSSVLLYLVESRSLIYNNLSKQAISQKNCVNFTK